ncbi:hypothetical protein FPOAC1_005335 [Fusarium poae]|uniref:hypothetical protein n=1 Tax=Fusarium poae TaxID=36050 RepID=UPI001CE96872|nr:hypothetical protein FPOAC1_005335 [Fusarium poae]KAG8672074.1 hypothetical protein FPOAC1_005335 [Fusarium poae]
MPRNYFTTVMFPNKGVKINITPTQLQLVFLRGPPDKEYENWAAANLRVRMEKSNLMEGWTPAEPRC